MPKLLKKKIQKERVENAMKNGGQRIAIDFTLSENMSNKVSTMTSIVCINDSIIMVIGSFSNEDGDGNGNTTKQ